MRWKGKAVIVGLIGFLVVSCERGKEWKVEERAHWERMETARDCMAAATGQETVACLNRVDQARKWQALVKAINQP